LFMGALIQAFQVSLLSQFYLAMIVVLGTSDGLFNMVLNTVALVFVLQLDRYIDFDLPDRNFYRIMTGSELLQQRGRWEAARAIYSDAMQVASSRPDRHLDLYRFALHFCRLAIALTIFLGAFLMQISTTTRGEFVKFIDNPRPDDDIVNDNDVNDSRKFPNLDWFWLLIAVPLLLDHHLTDMLGSERSKRLPFLPLVFAELVFLFGATFSLYAIAMYPLFGTFAVFTKVADGTF